MINEEFIQADTDKDGMVSLEEWRVAAESQPRIVKYDVSCKKYRCPIVAPIFIGLGVALLVSICAV